MKKEQMATCGGWGFIFIVGLFMALAGLGCSLKSSTPDFEKLKADLQNRLQSQRGDMTRGNSDIYSIVSLAVVNQTLQEETGATLDFEGEVECLTGFYMAANGEYAFSKPAWKAKRHVTRGSRIGFSGSAVYRRSGGDWVISDLIVNMGKGYFPPI